MGALGQLYGLKIDYYVAVDLNSFRGTINDARRRHRRRAGPGLRPGLPVGRRSRQPEALRAARHAVDERPARARLRALAPRLVATSTARPASSASSPRSATRPTSRRSSRRASSTSSSSRSRRASGRTSPPKMIPKLVSLAQEVDLDRRENLVLSSRRLRARSAIHAHPAGYWMLIANPANIRRAVQNVFSGNVKAAQERKTRRGRGRDRPRAQRRRRLEREGHEHRRCAHRARDERDGPADRGGSRRRRRLQDTVITIYNGAGGDLTAHAEEAAADVQGAPRSSKPTTPASSRTSSSSWAARRSRSKVGADPTAVRRDQRDGFSSTTVKKSRVRSERG